MSQDAKRIIKWLIVALIIIGSFVGIIVANQSPSGSGNASILGPVGNDEWIRGNPAATITLVEYSDFQCPACKSREVVVQQLFNEFSNHFRFVYRHFPLRTVHKNGQISAQAAEAAGLQGKFWEMHDLIFEKQTEWSNLSNDEAQVAFIGYAQTLGLNVEQFTTDLTSSLVEKLVNEDYDSGEAVGVRSTPTFFLDGVEINPNSYDEYRALIREKIDAASGPSA